MSVKIKGTFKKDTKEYDGLGAISDQLVANPLERVLVIAELEVETYETDVKGGGTKTPKMAYTSMEVMTGDDAITARKLRDAAYHERTGQTAPPPTLFDPDEHQGPGLSPAQRDEIAAEDRAEAAARGGAGDGFVEPGPDAAGVWPGDEGYTEPPPTKRRR